VLISSPILSFDWQKPMGGNLQPTQNPCTYRFHLISLCFTASQLCFRKFRRAMGNFATAHTKSASDLHARAMTQSLRIWRIVLRAA
jgi:hypothetical protein